MTENATPNSDEARGEPTFSELLNLNRQIKLDLERLLSDQASEKPQWLENFDIRAAVMQDFWNVLRFSEQSLLLTDRCLRRSEWWQSLYGQEPPVRRVRFEHRAFTQGSRFATLHLAAASLENSLRQLLRIVSPGTAKDARAEFKSVYEALLRTKLSAPDNDLVLCELVRLTRNTIHNMGVQKAPRADSVSVSYGGTVYSFVDGCAIEFATWEFVLLLTKEMYSLVDRTIRHPAIWDLAGLYPADWIDRDDTPNSA